MLVETRKSEYDHRIEHIRIRQRTKFDLTQILFFFDQIFPKRVFSIQNRKSEHHHRIQHIQISMDVILNRQTSFLDVEASRERNEFFITVYGKPTFNGVYIHFDSFFNIHI